MNETITLYRGDDAAIVEKDSEAEASMRALGFSEKVEKVADEKVEAKPEKVTKKGHK